MEIARARSAISAGVELCAVKIAARSARNCSRACWMRGRTSHMKWRISIRSVTNGTSITAASNQSSAQRAGLGRSDVKCLSRCTCVAEDASNSSVQLLSPESGYWLRIRSASGPATVRTKPR